MQREGNTVLKHARRATIALTTSALLATGLGAAPAAQAASPRSEAAAEWLADQLDGGLLYQEFGGKRSAQHGPSLDVYFAFEELQVQQAAGDSVLDAVEADADSYIGSGGESYAGATGKLLTAVLTEGLNPRTFAEVNLVARLKALVHSKRDRRFGRAMDASRWGDFSNTLTQAWAVRAFAGAEHRFVWRTTQYLLKQQCDAGFFRESMKGRNCEAARPKGNSAPSVDSTALSVLALKDARRAGVPKLGDDIRQALRWLAGRQNKNGSFTGNGVRNANSTGLAAWALMSTPWSDSASDAGNWLRKLQVTEANSTGTGLEEEVGAVAYDRAAFKNGADEGISESNAIQWALATAQAAVALTP